MSTKELINTLSRYGSRGKVKSNRKSIVELKVIAGLRRIKNNEKLTK